jgi:hypothetical protein
MTPLGNAMQNDRLLRVLKKKAMIHSGKEARNLVVCTHIYWPAIEVA